MDDKFSPHILAVATELWGDPNKSLSKPGYPRWGTHGARSVDVKRGVWSDHQEDIGGGVLDLIMREKGSSKSSAAKWMQEQGFISEDQSYSRNNEGMAPSNKDFGPHVDPQDPGYSGGPSEPSGPPDPKAKIVKTYDYTDAAGDLVMQVCRLEVPGRSDIPKSFRQRRPDSSKRDGWNWSVKGIDMVY